MHKKSTHPSNDHQAEPTEVKEKSGSNASEAIESILSNINMVQPKQKTTALGSNEIINGIVVGKIVRVSRKKIPMVDFDCNTAKKPLASLSTISVTSKDKGRDVALGFVSGDPRAPIILGFMHQAGSAPTHSVDTTEEGVDNISKAVTVEKDGETVTISADRQIVLKCGESSITLTRAGRFYLRERMFRAGQKGLTTYLEGLCL